uniref:Integrase catalytic domain-containing protein n=1 Tax=Phytophthora ramorum TaxID=164328 RepID=H3H286_PHYRM
MAADPLPEAVTVTIFMEGLRTGVARTEVFRVHPTSFEEAVSVALNAEFNFKSARAGWGTSQTNSSGAAGSSGGPEPMDLSHAEDEEAELLAAEQRIGIRRYFVCGSTQHLRPGCPLRAGRPTGEELSSVEPQQGGQQGLSPKSTVLYNTERVCKPGMLVVEATVKSFDKPWTILIDSGASGNYARRSTMEGSRQYAEALVARTSDIITVRLATGTRVTVPKIPVNLGVKFLDFDSVERCLVLDLDSRYDLILGMAWLERHEPWIDWRSKTLGATRLPPGEALASHEPTSARKQKRYWLEHWTETVNVLGIVVSELIDTHDVVDKSPEGAVRGAAHNPLSGTRCDNEPSLQAADGMVGRKPRHRGHSPDDARGAARYPLSSERHDGEESLRANDGAVGREPRHPGPSPNDACGVAHNPLGGDCELCSSSPDVEFDVDAPMKQQEVETPEDTFGVNMQASPRRMVSARRRQRRRVAAARRKASVMTQQVSGVVGSEQLYTLVTGVTGEVAGDVSLEAVPAADALLELDEMSIAEFGEALQAGELAEVALIRPEDELNSSSLMDETVLEDTRSRRLWPLPREQCDVIDAFFRAKHEAGMVRESKSPHSTPTFCVRKSNGKWRIVHAFNKLNAATIPAQTPIPRKDVLQNNMSSHLSQRMVCWLSFFAEYNFEVKYKPGRQNGLADALSRRPDYELSHVTTVMSSVTDLIRAAYARDDTCVALLRSLGSKEFEDSDCKLSARLRARLHRYSLDDGLLYYSIDSEDTPRIVVPHDEDLKYRILYEAHDTALSGHLGREKTYGSVSLSYWWPKLYKWTNTYVRTCETCLRVKPSPYAAAPLASLPIPSGCWESMSMDFVFGLPKDSDGNTGIVVFVDRLSKMAHLAAVPDTIDGKGTAKLFIDRIFRQHGLPESIVSDRDPRFTGKFWSSVFKVLGTRLDMSTTDHPQTDGQTERVNRVVEDVLRSVCAETPERWSTMLPLVEFALNKAVHASTGFTPFYVNGLTHPRVPLTLPLRGSGLVSAVFKTKLRPRFIGPFKVVAKKGLAYMLNLPKKTRTHPVFYVGLIKPYRDPARLSAEALAPGHATLLKSQQKVDLALQPRQTSLKVGGPVRQRSWGLEPVDALPELINLML